MTLGMRDSGPPSVRGESFSHRLATLVGVCVLLVSECLLKADSTPEERRAEIEERAGRAYWRWKQGGDRSELDAIAREVPLWPLLSTSLEARSDTLREWQAADVLGEYGIAEAIPSLKARLRRHIFERPALRDEDEIDQRQMAVMSLVPALAQFHDRMADAAIVEAAEHCNATDEAQGIIESGVFAALRGHPSQRFDLIEVLIPYARDWGRRHPELGHPFELAESLEAIVRDHKEHANPAAPGSSANPSIERSDASQSTVAEGDPLRAGESRDSPGPRRVSSGASWSFVATAAGASIVVLLVLLWRSHGRSRSTE